MFNRVQCKSEEKYSLRANCSKGCSVTVCRFCQFMKFTWPALGNLRIAQSNRYSNHIVFMKTKIVLVDKSITAKPKYSVSQYLLIINIKRRTNSSGWQQWWISRTMQLESMWCWLLDPVQSLCVSAVLISVNNVLTGMWMAEVIGLSKGKAAQVSLLRGAEGSVNE